MPAIDLDGVGPDEVDDESSPFKRTVALIAALVVLLGAVTAFLKDDASASGARLGAEAQSQAVQALGNQLVNNTEWETANKRAAEYRLLQARAFEARRQGDTDRGDALLGAAAELHDETPLLSTAEYSEDPYWPIRYQADTAVEAIRREFRRLAVAETADSWGARAEAYSAILTLLAAALFMLGLSLVARIGRRIFVVLGVLISVSALIFTLNTARVSTPTTPAAAVEALVEGQRLMIRGSYEEAIDAFSEAIELREDYAPAFVGRAQARWQLSADADPREPYIEYIFGEDLQRALEDAQSAVANGAVDNLTLNLLAALLIHDEQYAQAESRLEQILDQDEALALAWANLGATRVAMGDADGASEAYHHAIALAPKDPLPRRSFDAVNRSVLEEVAVRRPQQRTLATEMSTAITVAQLRASFTAAPEQPQGAVGAAGVTAQRSGLDLVATLPNSFQPDTPAAFLWYRRAGPDGLWVQPSAMSTLWPLSGAGQDVVRTTMGKCPVAGEYRVDVTIGSSVVASAELSVPELAAGPVLFEEEDIGAGASLCRPESWELEEGDSTLVIKEPDTGATVRAWAEHRPPASTGAAANNLDPLLSTQLGPSYETIRPAADASLGGLSGRYVVGRSADGAIRLVFAAWDGELVREVMTDAPADMATLTDEILATVSFLGLSPSG